jgi:hypothetical protein
MNNGVVNNQTFHTFESFDGLYLNNVCQRNKKQNKTQMHNTMLFFIYEKITRGTNYGTQVGSKDFHCHKCGVQTHQKLSLHNNTF